jgi:hypothetical protein
LDPGSVTLRIRIRIRNPDPDPWARKLRNFSGKMHFLVIFLTNLPLKRYKIALTTVLFEEKKFDEKHRFFLFDLTQILISKKFEKEIVFESSVLAWSRSRIRIKLKCWIRIRIPIESIRIHNPEKNIPVLRMIPTHALPVYVVV